MARIPTLPSDFEDSFFKLMVEFRSEQSLKLKRNIDVLSFTIIAANYVNLKLSDIKIFGADLTKVDVSLVKGVVVFIFIYWTIMLSGYLFKDKNYNKERKILLEKQLSILDNYKDRTIKQLETMDETHQSYVDFQGRIEQVDNEYAKYHAQIERTKNARLTQKVLKYIEFVTPYTLMCIALFILLIENKP